MINLTEKSLSLFADLVEDADNWSGTPLFDGDASDRGNLMDLKKNGLLFTQAEEGCVWVFFTDEGKAFAKDKNLSGAEYL